jgi:hypothetical protein
MNEKVLLDNDDLRLKKYDNGIYILNTYDGIGKYNGEVVLAKEDIERIYFAMKLNEVK